MTFTHLVHPLSMMIDDIDGEDPAVRTSSDNNGMSHNAHNAHSEYEATNCQDNTPSNKIGNMYSADGSFSSHDHSDHHSGSDSEKSDLSESDDVDEQGDTAYYFTRNSNRPVRLPAGLKDYECS